MLQFIAILTGVICVFLIIAVLIQNPKGGGVDSSFGGTAANQMFGAARSADLIEKITWGLAAALFILCIVATLVVSGTAVGGTQSFG